MMPSIVRCYPIMLIVMAEGFTPSGRSLFTARPFPTPPSSSKVVTATEKDSRISKLRMVSAIVDSSPECCPPMVDDLSTPVSGSGLSPIEVWLLVTMEEWYRDALALKCPWMRRRALDCIDTIEIIARACVILPQNLGIVGPPMGCRGDHEAPAKQTGLSMEQLSDVVRQDWKQETMKGYYVTGTMSEFVYRDDCLFDGPDPDMPVKGLRKFCGAASQLFDRKLSTAELLDCQVVEQAGGNVIVVKWRMNGVLRLPFQPKMPEVVGRTTYYLDDDMLVYKHFEEWDISAVEAFYKTDWFCNVGGAHHNY
jgi:Uncharacterized conserved protein (DUF2358)